MWEAMPFDFGDLIMTLVENAVTSTDFLRILIWAQRVHFPDLRVDWQGILNDHVIDQLSKIPLRLFRVLVEASVSSRSICMSEEHQYIVDAKVWEIPKVIMSIEDEMDEDKDENDETSRIKFSHCCEEIRDLVTIMLVVNMNIY